ncbi:MAG TPA: hypothetical protein VF131_25260 [Blastocatellia bacterium]|nr:hypothetical protein [Blastocatellia bacterium]
MTAMYHRDVRAGNPYPDALATRNPALMHLFSALDDRSIPRLLGAG